MSIVVTGESPSEKKGLTHIVHTKDLQNNGSYFSITPLAEVAYISTNTNTVTCRPTQG